MHHFAGREAESQPSVIPTIAMLSIDQTSASMGLTSTLPIAGTVKTRTAKMTNRENHRYRAMTDRVLNRNGSAPAAMSRLARRLARNSKSLKPTKKRAETAMPSRYLIRSSLLRTTETHPWFVHRERDLLPCTPRNPLASTSQRGASRGRTMLGNRTLQHAQPQRTRSI